MTSKSDVTMVNVIFQIPTMDYFTLSARYEEMLGDVEYKQECPICLQEDWLDMECPECYKTWCLGCSFRVTNRHGVLKCPFCRTFFTSTLEE